MAIRGLLISHQTLANWYGRGDPVVRLPPTPDAKSGSWRVEVYEAIVAGRPVRVTKAVVADQLVELVALPLGSRSSAQVRIERLLAVRNQHLRPIPI